MPRLSLLPAALALALGVVWGSTADAQDRPFLFSVTTAEADKRAVAVHFDAGFGERPFDVTTDAGRLEQRLGMQASFGRGLTMIASVGFSTDERDARTSQHAELLVNVLNPAHHAVALAVGGGLRHESAGVDVLLGRVAAGRPLGVSRLQGNVIFEKPLATDRDAVDLITTVGWSRPIARALYLGVEGIGEDLEGFWEENEAEGGARLLVGPSFRVAPPAAKWQIALVGGPVFHATESAVSSTARALPRQTARAGFAVRTSLSYGF